MNPFMIKPEFHVDHTQVAAAMEGRLLHLYRGYLYITLYILFQTF